MEIFEDDDGRWHVRDRGLGIEPEHLKQDEDEEKLQNPDKVIEKVRVGLKDALATFYRTGVNVQMNKHSEPILSTPRSPRECCPFRV